MQGGGMNIRPARQLRRRVSFVEGKLEMKFQPFYLALLFVISACVSLSAQTTDGPAVVAAAAPVYPAIAAAAHASGEVTVDVKIDASGKVISARAVSGHSLLQAVSVAAARRWRFVPANETDAERTARLTFSFIDTKANAPEEERTAVFLPPYKVQVAGPMVVRQTIH
jgi:TonB family protein